MSVIDVEPAVEIPAPRTLAETGLRADEILHLLVKALHFAGELIGLELADRLGLGFSVIEPGIEMMKTQRLCEIVGGTSLGPPSYRYRITQLGREHANTFLERNMYTGVAPVPLDQYRRYMTDFKKTTERPASRREVKDAFAHLVLSDRVLDQLGPAINAGHSLFVYGPPGNGKTVIAQGIRNVLPGDLWIPHAIEVDGSLIQVFDPVNHERLPDVPLGPGLESMVRHDARWVHCRRPAVMVGGELMLEHLELTYSPNAGFYRAPVQLLANGGVLIIDDFGRQRVRPRDLLNRWIVPLEKRMDFLTLHTGHKFPVPFDSLLIFATNLDPLDLVDEAFLRRIHYKIFVPSPTKEDYQKIFRRVCVSRQIAYRDAAVDWIYEHFYARLGIAPRSCHPRDVVDHLCDYARFVDAEPVLSEELLQGSCASYFLDMPDGGGEVGAGVVAADANADEPQETLAVPENLASALARAAAEASAESMPPEAS